MSRCSFCIPSGLHLTIAEGLSAEHSVLQITLEASKGELLEKLQAAFKHFIEPGDKVGLLTYAEACATSSSLLLLHPNAGTCYHHIFSLLCAKDCLGHSGNKSYQNKELVISLPYQTHHLPPFLL